MHAAAGAVMGGALLVQIAASPSPAHAWMVQAGAIPPSQAEMPHATQPKVKIMSTNIHASLNGTPWTVVENAFSDKTAEFPGTLTFNGDQLRLDGPCNFFTTQIIVNGNGLTIFPFGSMPKTCGPEAMEAEGALLSALMRVTQFTISGSTLTLSSADGRQMLKAERA